MHGRKVFWVITTALIAALIFIACGQHSSRVLRNIVSLQSQQQDDSANSGPLPCVMQLDAQVGAMRSTSAAGTIETEGWQAYLEGTTGTSGSSPYNIESEGTTLTLRAFAPGEYSYALYGQAVGADPKPQRTLIDSEVCKIGGGRDDEIPLSYYIGIADYTIGSWRWFGPFGDVDVLITVNSETLKSRFKSPNDNYYLAVLASNGSKAASALPAEGSNEFPLDTSARRASLDDDDPGGLTIEEVVTWVEDNLLTEPAIVTGLQATADTGGVALTWDTNIDPDVFVYQVLRDDPDDEDPAILLQGVLAPTVEYVDTTGIPGKRYMYSVRARNDAGFGAPANVLAARLAGSDAPAPPTGLTANSGEVYGVGNIYLTWNPNLEPDLLGYLLYRRVEGEAEFIEIADLGASVVGFTDTNLLEGLTYEYVLTAYNTLLLESAYSDIVMAMPYFLPDVTPPVWTSDVGITSAVPGNSEVTITWGEAIDAESPPIEYLVFVAESSMGDPWLSMDSVHPASTLETTIDGLTNGTEYVFGVRARDDVGNVEANTNTLIATPSAEWVHTWGGSSADAAETVAVDANGDIVVLANTDSFGAGNRDVCILKYSPSGDILWKKTWGGSGNDETRKLALDSSGNAYIAGFTYSFGTGEDAFLLKYDPDGNLLLQKNWGSNNRDEGYAVALDAFGNIYLTGWTDYISSANTEAFLLKYSSDGTLLWQKMWGGSGLDYGYDLAVDGGANIYISGPTWSFGAGERDIFSLKYDTDGNLLWQRIWGGPSREETTTVLADESGNFYITGFTSSFGVGANDIFLIKYDTNGTFQWDRVWGGGGNDYSEGIGFDASGNIALAGHTASFGVGSDDATLLAYDVSGNLLWQKLWGASGYQAGSAVCAASGSRLYFAGRVPNASGAWSTPSGSYSDPSALTDSILGNDSSISGNQGIPSGTETTPEGTIDTGGGGDDSLIMKVDTSAW